MTGDPQDKVVGTVSMRGDPQDKVVGTVSMRGDPQDKVVGTVSMRGDLFKHSSWGFQHERRLPRTKLGLSA